MDQVKDIVRRAVDEKERALREQYDRILATKLQGEDARPSTHARTLSTADLPRLGHVRRAIHGVCQVQ